MIPQDKGAKWRATYLELERIANDPTETPERRRRAQAAVSDVRRTQVSSMSALRGERVNGNRGGNDYMRTEAEHEGWEPGR